jgi:hypothetical protein
MIVHCMILCRIKPQGEDILNIRELGQGESCNLLYIDKGYSISLLMLQSHFLWILVLSPQHQVTHLELKLINQKIQC